MKPRISEPKFLSKHLTVHPKARVCRGILEQYQETDVFDLCFELRYMPHGGCFLAVECRKDEKGARQRLYNFGQDQNVVILGGWPREHFEVWRFFDDDFKTEPELLYATPEEWRLAYDLYLKELQGEGCAVLGDFRSVEMMHPALLGKSLGSSSAQKPENSRAPAGTAPPAKNFEITTPEEVLPRPGEFFVEGSVISIFVNKYERDPEVRRRCIEHYGYSCQICTINLSQVYPGIGKGDFIHVHHLLPLGSVGEEHPVDPIKDLLPVCPNCHAMLHRRVPPYTPDELRTSFFRRIHPALSEDEFPF